MAVAIDGGIVLLTGASSGIGESMARLLAPRVNTLVLVARREERLEQLKNALQAQNSQLKVDVRPTDLSNVVATRELAAQVLAEHGRIDVLINNAGIGHVGVLEEADEAHLDALLGVNILGLTALTRAVLPSMVERQSGGIWNISSGFGLVWMPFFSVYVASKQYVTAFSECLRSELKGTGVTVCQTCPGPIATEFESTAGSPLDRDAPVPIRLSADAAARSILRGFERNSAIHVPGIMGWISISVGRLIPRPLYRFFYGLLAQRFRAYLKRQSA